MEKTEGTGQRVGGYRVVRKLATGGTSDVLLAKAEGPHGFERSVVLKLLLPEYKHDAEFKGMFAREAAAYARLSHPSIVRLYDFFSNDDQLVMVLEYIDGPPLSRLRGMLKAVGQQLDDTTALYIASSIFDALAAAHGAVDDSGEPAPVIHRDVNPSNVLIPWDGNVKLADFGVAKVTGASHQSSVGLIRGTFGYMAPEQVKGETVTPRADVYAGAIILWEMLTKRRAFIRGALPEIEVLRELAEPRIVSIDVIRPDLDKSVRDAIKRALQPHGDKRTITAEEIASILRAVVPESEGREKLAKALALVRHEPRPSATSIPPPVTMTFGDPDPTRYEPRVPMTTKPGISPRMTPPPRPAVTGFARQTSPYGATPPQAPLAGSPRPPVVTPPRPGPKPSEPPPVTDAAPSSERGLAALLEPSESDPDRTSAPRPLRRTVGRHARSGTRSTTSSATCRATCRPTSSRRRTLRAAFRAVNPSAHPSEWAQRRGTPTCSRIRSRAGSASSQRLRRRSTRRCHWTSGRPSSTSCPFGRGRRPRSRHSTGRLRSRVLRWGRQSAPCPSPRMARMA